MLRQKTCLVSPHKTCLVWQHTTCLGIVLGSLRDRFAVVVFLKAFAFVGIVLGRFFNSLRVCWDRSGIVLGWCWDRFAMVSGSSW